MKKLMIAALAAAQIAAAAQPAMAANFGDDGRVVAQRQGAFAGARLRIALDGTSARKVKAGLTVAPIVQGRQADGSIRTRFGEGTELRLTGAKPQFALGGRPISQLAQDSQLAQGGAGPEGRKAGISTIGWVAIGVGVAALVLVAAGVACQQSEDCSGGE